MQNESMKLGDVASAALIAGATAHDKVGLHGVFTVEHVRDGKVIWSDTFPNVVTTQGRNAILDTFLNLSAAYANVVMGLHTTVGNASSVYATPSPQVESTAYSNANRPAVSFSAASGGVKSTSAAVSFNINGTATITGCFIALGPAGVTTKGDTAASNAILLSTGTFTAGSRSVINGDTLNVSYSLTAT